MHIAKLGREIKKFIIILSAVLLCILLIQAILPTGESKNKITDIFLTRPTFAQESTTFPADEAGISAYVNVGQSIDLSKIKSALRGIQAESSNYVIGIIELPGLPEEEFPHIYISSDGWILAYYSKFAPVSRIFQWYGYEGGIITTTTLQDAIAKICPTIGANFNQIKTNIGYYHFKYPEAMKLLLAVEWIPGDKDIDTFTFSIPYEATLYEGSWAHYAFDDDYMAVYNSVYVDNTKVSQIDNKTALVCDFFKQAQTSPDKLHTIELRTQYLKREDRAGVAAVFIYQ